MIKEKITENFGKAFKEKIQDGVQMAKQLVKNKLKEETSTYIIHMTKTVI